MDTIFKKEFLSFDNERFTSVVETYAKQCADLNKTISETERILKLENGLTADEKKQIIVNGQGFILDYLEPKKPFPNASLEFNLEAMGLNEVNDLLKTWKQNQHLWLDLNLQLDNNVFVLSETFVNELRESMTLYTKSKEQNSNLKQLKILVSELNKAYEANLITGHLSNISTHIIGVKTDTNQKTGKLHYVVDPYNV
jgi:hypothetical protein